MFMRWTIRAPSDAEPDEYKISLTATSQHDMSAVFDFRVLVGGPRTIPGSPPLSVSLSAGESASITLTDHIEDSLGGPLTFAHGSTPTGLRVIENGAQWEVESAEDMEPGWYTITVIATEANGLSVDFSLRIGVEVCHVHVVFDGYSPLDPSVVITIEVTGPEYAGSCKNGRANGQGTITEGNWTASLSLSFTGEWKGGQLNGLGTGTIEYNGAIWRYTGAWVEGHPHGQGTWSFIYPTGDWIRYVGEFRNGLLHGQGILTIYNAAEGDSYLRDSGEFRNGRIWNGTSTIRGGGFVNSCNVVNGEISIECHLFD